MKPNRIPTLDGWRAIAIMLVVICHLGECLYANQADYEASLSRYGAFGVDLFFGLSGLLITKLLLEESRATGTISLGRFYARRAFRILPAYFAFLIGFTFFGLWQSGLELLSCLFFFRNYTSDTFAGAGTQHLWSLSVEEHFYLLWPGLLVALGPKRAKEWPARLALGVALWRMVESQMTTHLFPWAFDRFRTDLRLDALLWGCAVAFMLDDSEAREKLRKQLPVGGWLVVAAIVLVSIRFFMPLTSVLVAALIPFLLAGTVLRPTWLFSRFLELTPVAWLGRVSYSLYLWQAVFLIPAWEHPVGWWRQWPANLVLCVLAAAASYYGIEQPFLRMGRRWAAVGSSSILVLDAALRSEGGVFEPLPSEDAGYAIVPDGADRQSRQSRP